MPARAFVDSDWKISVRLDPYGICLNARKGIC